MADLTPKQFREKNERRLDGLMRAVGIKLFSSVIRDTPVGDPDLWKSQQHKERKNRKGPAGYVGGRLRGNWQCSLASPNLTTFEDNADEPTYSRNFSNLGEQLQHVTETAQAANRFDSLWLSNSLPYAHRIEYDGHSSQAPQGMVRRNVNRIKQLISAELRRIKSGA